MFVSNNWPYWERGRVEEYIFWAEVAQCSSIQEYFGIHTVLYTVDGSTCPKCV